jgi:hypothetical protein
MCYIFYSRRFYKTRVVGGEEEEEKDQITSPFDIIEAVQ